MDFTNVVYLVIDPLPKYHDIILFLQFQFSFAHEVLADFIDKFDNYANFKDMI